MPSLAELTEHLHIFNLDRPVMARQNRGEGEHIGKPVATLLANEGIEFEERMQIHDRELVIDLLALYEIADIIIFSITLLQILGEDPNNIIYEFEPEKSQLQMLRKMGDATSNISVWAKGTLTPEHVIQDAKDAAMYGIALIYSLGVDPMAICFEKLGHNISRYPAVRFQENHDYDTERKKCKRVAKEYGLEESFYSPLSNKKANPVYKITT